MARQAPSRTPPRAPARRRLVALVGVLLGGCDDADRPPERPAPAGEPANGAPAGAGGAGGASAPSAGAAGASAPAGGAGGEAGAPAPDGGRPPACSTDEDLVALEGHACLHVMFGPFATVAAGPDAPAVSAPHTAYTLRLPAGGAEGRATFRPGRDGDYVFFTDADVAITAEGAPPSCAGPTLGGCEGLRARATFALGGGVEYALAVRAREPLEQVVLVIERR